MNDDEKWRERIVIDPGLHHGEPCIKGTRVAVSVIVANLTERGIEQNFIKSKARDLFFVAPDVGSAIEHIRTYVPPVIAGKWFDKSVANPAK